MKLSLAMTIAALAALLSWPAYAAAQPAPDGVIEMADPANPPIGYSGPRPIGPRDISMANYPSKSFLAGEEGKTTIRVLVGVDGMVTNPQIATPSGSPRLDQAAVQLVKGWQYVPAMRGGTPIAARFPVIVDWKLLTVPFEVSPARAKKGGARFYPPASGKPLQPGTISAQFMSFAPDGGGIAHVPERYSDFDFSRKFLKRGTTIAKFLVAADGTIANGVIEKSGGDARLDDATITMVKNWSFAPATLQDGQAASVWVRISVDWQLFDPGPPRRIYHPGPSYGATRGPSLWPDP